MVASLTTAPPARMMDGWMDGWMDGRMEGWVDEWVDVEYTEWMDGY